MTPTPTNYSQGQIDQLAEYMRQGFGEIKTMLQALDNRVRAIEQNEAGCYPVMTQRIDNTFVRLNELEKCGDDREKRLFGLEHDMRVMQKALWFVGSAAGTAIMALLWQLLTGQIHLAP
jgi:hypothetical protein